MSANLLFDLISLAVQAQFDCEEAPPVILIGQYGMGKGRGYVHPISRAINKALITIYLPKHDAAELNGYPYANLKTETMQHFPAHWAHRIQNEIGPENTVLFIDEASDAPRSTQAAAHGFLTDGIVGECSVKGCAMILASNPPNISTTGGTLSAAVGNRVFQIEAELDTANLIRQVKLGRWDVNEVVKLPKGWTKTIPESMSMIGAFWECFPHHVLITMKELEERGEDIWKPTHTPRTWEFFWVLRAAAIASGQQHLLHAIAMGTVGTPGVEYLDWEKDLEFGDPEKWLANPQGQKLPEEDDRVFAVINAVMGAIKRNNTRTRWHLGWDLLKYFYDNGKGDIASVGACTLADKKNRPAGLKNNPAGIVPFIPMLKAAGFIPGGK